MSKLSRLVKTVSNLFPILSKWTVIHYAAQFTNISMRVFFGF